MRTLSLILLILSTFVCLSTADQVSQSLMGFVQDYVCDHFDDFKLSQYENPEMFAACGRESAVDDKITSSELTQHGHHPRVTTHATIWYKNWMTCTICQSWTKIFRTLATDPLYIESLQGFAWFLCSTQFSQSFCKYYVASQVQTLDVEIFPIVLSEYFMCGYLFDICTTNYYVELKTIDYETNTIVMADKPATTLDNSFLDQLYSVPKQSSDFKLLWISDIDIDLNYVYESSNNCADASCCHAQNIPITELDLAPLYGHQNCNLPMDGFYKMIDTLNKFNATSDFDFNSILYGGSGSAVNPEQLTQAQVISVHEKLIKYMRQMNDYVGIYFTLGPHDVFPIDYQLFEKTAQKKPVDLWAQATGAVAATYTEQSATDQTAGFTAESTAASALLASINTAIHPLGVTDSFPSHYSSIAADTTSQTSFLNAGYYYRRPVVYMQGYDGGSPPKAITAYPKNDLAVVSINTNACHNRNFALMREREDPGGQLAWLITTLKDFETNGYKAWIMGNVNPGSKYCNSRWARRYNSIVNRFQATVRAQFFGHESEEYFQLQMPQAGQAMNPFGVTFQGAKASSLGQNPQFKIIKMDYTNFMPQEIVTYEFDLAAANQDPFADPITLIKKLRSMPSDLDGASSLRPFDLYAFISKLNITEQVAIDFNNKFCPTQNTDSSNLCRITECGTICRHNMACKLGNASSIDIMSCRKVGLQDVDYGLEYMISLLENPWVTFCAVEGTAPCNKNSLDSYSYYSH